jgi:predicted HTH domain antitoxin
VKVEIDLDVPADVIDASFEASLREDAIYRLFGERRIASGHAARLLGLGKRDFLEALDARGIAHTDYTAADWLEDTAAISRIVENPTGA